MFVCILESPAFNNGDQLVVSHLDLPGGEISAVCHMGTSK